MEKDLSILLTIIEMMEKKVTYKRPIQFEPKKKEQ
jgi:hypothetical protein